MNASFSPSLSLFLSPSLSLFLRYFAGTRYLKRGINDRGYVANHAETEQVSFLVFLQSKMYILILLFVLVSLKKKSGTGYLKLPCLQYLERNPFW